jgi:uncharacterized integral membrane protein (TIGR00698 family)
MKKNELAKILLPFICLVTLTPWFSPSLALVSGILFTVVFGNPYLDQTKKLTQKFLSIAVIGLGFGINLSVIGKVGIQGIGYTIIGISFTFLLGFILQNILKTDKATSLLITAGTAICGGSAIAAVAPVIRAKSQEVSIALGTVFLLNALALFLFPIIGHSFNLTEIQFGMWSALAIHDTSSVVGATLKYGPTALNVGTTMKLTRALWIIPMAIVIDYFWNKKNQSNNETQGAKKPWFILGFIIAATIVTLFPVIQPLAHIIELSAKKLIVLTLFLIGANLNKEALKAVGLKPILLGVVLWISSAVSTFVAIYFGIIK